MPFYDYRCLECNNTFEIRTEISNKKNIIITQCLNDKTRQCEFKSIITNPPTTKLNGSGFYETDYK